MSPPHARQRGPATVAKPSAADLDGLRAEAAGCRACPLWQRATQTVFGEGPPDAALMLVGEQPGDQEDLEGSPFFGPSGRLLNRALSEVGIDRLGVYVTNAVKHFKWEERGPRRLHKKPSRSEVLACHPWLAAEVAAVAPKLLVLLGAVATESVFGPEVKVLRDRGKVLDSPLGVPALATVHPSSILRARDDDDRDRQYGAWLADLRVAAAALRT